MLMKMMAVPPPLVPAYKADLVCKSPAGNLAGTTAFWAPLHLPLASADYYCTKRYSGGTGEEHPTSTTPPHYVCYRVLRGATKYYASTRRTLSRWSWAIECTQSYFPGARMRRLAGSRSPVRGGIHSRVFSRIPHGGCCYTRGSERQIIKCAYAS